MSSRYSSPTPAPGNDPMAAMLQRASARSGGTGAHRRAFGDEDGPDGGEDMASSDDSRFLTGPVGTALLEGTAFPFNPVLSQTEIRARAQAFKKQRTLSPRSDEDFEVFTNINCPAEHIFRMYHTALENRDLLTTLSAGKAYSVPEDVKNSISIYAQVFTLSPGILGYKKKTNPATVLSILRSQGVSSIPPAHDQGRAEIVLKAITKALTDARHQIKNQIQSSIEDYKTYGKGSPGIDLAALADKCIGSGKTKATLGLLMRVAFLRWIMVEYPDKIEKFWNEVDARLDEVRKEKKTATERETAAQLVYEEDVLKYGPLDPEFPTISPERLDDWIKATHRYAAASANTVAV